MRLRLRNFNLDLQFDNVDFLSEKTEVKPENGGYAVFKTIKNSTERTVDLKELSVKICGIDFNCDIKDDYFYSSENIRLYGNTCIPVDFDRVDENAEKNKKYGITLDKSLTDKGAVSERICASPYQPFPAILLSNYHTLVGVVAGSLSQDVFYHNYKVCRNDEGKIQLTVYSSFKGIKRRKLKSGESLTDIFYLGQTENADDFNGLFNTYGEVLRKYLPDSLGKKRTNGHGIIWGSWNDGIFRNVSEDFLIKQAKAVKKLFPTVEWFQIDDGYSAYCSDNHNEESHGLGVVYEGEDGIDKRKFPNGLNGYVERVKETGLKPAVWIGGLCPYKSLIVKERKEWFLDFAFRETCVLPLDVSRKEVRDYLRKAIEVFFGEYRFEGLKMDFWSYAFEDGNVNYFTDEKSGYEYRSWLLGEIRKYLPDYGYIGACCDIGCGNPFLGNYFDNYRFGLDVEDGNWEKFVITAKLATAVLPLHIGDLIVPNSDALGMLTGLNDTEFATVVNFKIITRTLVEISGRFDEVDEEDLRLKTLQKATAYLNNGEDVYFAKYSYRSGKFRIPEIIYLKSAWDCDSKEYYSVGIFNFDDKEKEISFDNGDLSLDNKKRLVEEGFNGKNYYAENYRFLLKQRESVIIKIKV